MSEFTVYYVGFYKHNSVQHLSAGPFCDWEDAEKKREELGDRYVIVESTVKVRES